MKKVKKEQKPRSEMVQATVIFRHENAIKLILSESYGKHFQLYVMIDGAMNACVAKTIEPCLNKLKELKPTESWLYIPRFKYVIYIKGCSCSVMKLKFKPNKMQISGIDVDCYADPMTDMEVIPELVKQSGSKFSSSDSTPFTLIQPEPRKCGYCHKKSTMDLLKCSQCFNTFYCNEHCRTADQTNHQEFCFQWFYSKSNNNN